MKNICLYFQVHQPYRLRKAYRFFDIGKSERYFDDILNKDIIKRISENCYLPTNKLIFELIEKYGNKFKIAFSVSGTAIEQFEEYAPEVLDSFKQLAKTGNVEFLAETYSHSLVSLYDKENFKQQVTKHSEKIENCFGVKPSVFRNTELIYSNEIGETIAQMGFKAILAEGAKHVLGWKSPNLLYYNVLEPELKILTRNFTLSDDIAFRFSDKQWAEYPLTSEKFAGWLNEIDKNDEIVNIFMDYETFGEHQKQETGIFDFLKHLPEAILSQTDLEFATPSEIAKNHQPVAAFNTVNPISWADYEKDTTAWKGNEMQKDALNKLTEISEKINFIDKPEIQKRWSYLQTSDHFYYMSTKLQSDGAVHDYFSNYDSPYEAFINYMNILNDFKIRVDKEYEKNYPETETELISKIQEYEKKIEELKNKLNRPKIIAGIKKKPIPVSRTKKIPKAISKKKKESTPISKTKKKTKAISKTKKVKKALKPPDTKL